MPTVQRKKPQQYRKVSDDFYHTVTWRNETKHHRMANPYCFYCNLKGIFTPATLTDHFRPRRLYPELSLVNSNYRSSCDECHNKKRQFESTIATKAQFEVRINEFIKSISK